jgi:hypothetical protein
VVVEEVEEVGGANGRIGGIGDGSILKDAPNYIRT